MEADLVGARHRLQQDDTRQTQALVLLQSLGGILDGAQAGGEGRAVLDCHCRALTHKRVHRVAGVAQ
jgi:hypothetical protein